MIVDDDLLVESYQDTHCHCGHRPIIMAGHHHHQTHPLAYVDSGRSETSADEATPYRNAYRDTTCPAPGAPNRDQSHYKILDSDPDCIQVMGDADLQQLPEAVNREILKNSREIIFGEPETSREGSPLLRSCNRRNLARYPLLDEERRSLNSSKRNFYHRNIVRGLDEDKRSLDGSRRNLAGSRRYLLIPLDGKNAEASSKENFHTARRHTGSRERLNAMRKNVSAKGSNETPELSTRGRLNSNDDRLMIEMEKSAKSQRLQDVLLSESNRTSLSDPNLSPMEYASPSKNGQSLIPALAVSPISDLSPESGFYEGTQWSSSPEYARKDLRLPNEPTIARNRRSYENAQLQDVNESMSRPNSNHSSLDSEESSKNFRHDNSRGCSNERNVVNQKQPISYTSV